MSAPSPDQPSQEEIEAYMAQLRQAPVQDLLLQAFSVLGTGAEVKLGLPDARILIDAMDALVGVAAPTLGEQGGQLAEAVGQLKMAQVQAEKQVAAQQGGQQEPGAGEAAAAPPPQPAEPEKKQTDKLWIPGRDG